VHLLEARDASALLVREHDLEAVAAGVREGELRPRVGTLAAAEGARALRPGRKVEGKLGHPGALALAAGAVERREPSLLGYGQAGRAHALREVIAHREGEPAGGDRAEEVVRGPGRVAAHEGAAAGGPVRQLREGELKQRDVVGGPVGTGVTGAQDAGEGLARAGLEAKQRVEAEAALVGAGRALLLGVRREQRGVDVEDEASRVAGVAPGAGAGRGAGLPDPGERGLVEALNAAVGGGLRGDRPEEHLLVAQRAEVGQAVAAVGEHHGEVARHAPGLVTHLAGVAAQNCGEALREAQRVGEPAEQGGACP